MKPNRRNFTEFVWQRTTVRFVKAGSAHRVGNKEKSKRKK